MPPYKYFELVFQNKSDSTLTYSMCVLGYREPTLEEAKEFWKKDCELYSDEFFSEIYEISSEDAHESFDMSNECNFPIFNKESKWTQYVRA